DFVVQTHEGTERIARAAFEYAKKAGKTRVTCVTKANVVKTTDGKTYEAVASADYSLEVNFGVEITVTQVD
ncbi:MAG: hypothetical protein IKU28_03755, partial [Erysipelotrichaceae bacterium]|nr:hypothetical protein [Erysipelotrichaceae bacterium]